MENLTKGELNGSVLQYSNESLPGTLKLDCNRHRVLLLMALLVSDCNIYPCKSATTVSSTGSWTEKTIFRIMHKDEY